MVESDSENYKRYCICLGESLREYVIEAQENRKKSRGTDNDAFDSGYLCAYYGIITLMQQQAEIFDIPYDILGIDFNETDLII